MTCNEVTKPSCSSVSGGPRNVVPTEPRSASQSVVCQRSVALGLKVDPTPPP